MQIKRYGWLFGESLWMARDVASMRRLFFAKHTADVETGDLAEAAGHTTMNILLDH